LTKKSVTLTSLLSCDESTACELDAVLNFVCRH